jgi:hypothetical protein
VKIKGQHAPVRQATTAPTAASKKASAASSSAAPRPQGLSGPARDHGKIRGEKPTDWKGLAQISQQGLFGETSSKPAAKFFEALGSIDKALRTSSNPEKIAQAMLNHDARREVFRLESLLRLYKSELGEGALTLVKELEDHIGAVTSFEHAKETAQKNGAPAAVVERLGELQKASEVAMVQLVREKWMPGKDGTSVPVAQISKAIAGHDFGSEKQARKDFANNLAGVVDKLRKGFDDFSMKDLDQGVHKMRRQLRWVALYMESGGGLVQTAKADKPNEHFGPLLASTSKKDLATILGEGLPPLRPGEKAIEIPEDLYFGLQKSILDLGQIKDDCEAHELIRSAYADMGMKPAEIEKKLGSKGTPADMTARATVIRDAIDDSKLLKQLQRALEDAA